MYASPPHFCGPASSSLANLQPSFFHTKVARLEIVPVFCLSGHDPSTAYYYCPHRLLRLRFLIPVRRDKTQRIQSIPANSIPESSFAAVGRLRFDRGIGAAHLHTIQRAFSLIAANSFRCLPISCTLQHLEGCRPNRRAHFPNVGYASPRFFLVSPGLDRFTGSTTPFRPATSPLPSPSRHVRIHEEAAERQCCKSTDDSFGPVLSRRRCCDTLPDLAEQLLILKSGRFDSDKRSYLESEER